MSDEGYKRDPFWDPKGPEHPTPPTGWPEAIRRIALYVTVAFVAWLAAGHPGA